MELSRPSPAEVFGPDVVQVMRQIDALKKADGLLAVPPWLWRRLHTELARRLEPEVLDSPVGREIIRELMRRSKHYENRANVPGQARRGPITGMG